MPSKREESYWAERRERLRSQLETDEDKLNAKLAKTYEAELAKLRRDIKAYYAEYGEDNVIAYRRLLQTLSDDDRAMLMQRMDDFAEKYPQWAHLMPVRESIYRLNELEGIQRAIWMQQMEIGAIEQEELEAHLEKHAQLGANLAAEQLGFGEAFYTINAQVIADTVNAQWADGRAYSDTIWANRERLASYLNDEFAKGVARGLKYDDMARDLATIFMHSSTRNAKRLIFTEGTFVLNESQARVFEQDFEYYTFESVDDSRVCEVCRDVQAQTNRDPVRYEERQTGVNFPPLHPWCRCSAVPYVEDWDAWIESYVARNGG